MPITKQFPIQPTCKVHGFPKEMEWPLAVGRSLNIYSYGDGRNGTHVLHSSDSSPVVSPTINIHIAYTHSVHPRGCLLTAYTGGGFVRRWGFIYGIEWNNADDVHGPEIRPSTAVTVMPGPINISLSWASLTCYCYRLSVSCCVPNLQRNCSRQVSTRFSPTFLKMTCPDTSSRYTSPPTAGCTGLQEKTACSYRYLPLLVACSRLRKPPLPEERMPLLSDENESRGIWRSALAEQFGKQAFTEKHARTSPCWVARQQTCHSAIIYNIHVELCIAVLNLSSMSLVA